MNDATKKIAQDFKDLATVNPVLRSMLKKLVKGNASYLDADKYALELAMVLGRALHLNLGDRKLEGEAYQELIREVLPKGMHSIYEEVADYAQTIQKGINERMGIGLNAVKPEFNDKEADAIAEKAASVDRYDDIPGGINQDMQHMAQNVATDTMKANAKLANDVGMEATVTRIYDSVGVHTQGTGKYKKECSWCLARCGTDVPYSKAISMDMFRRHPGCGCKISYTVNGRTQVQTEWKSNRWEDHNTGYLQEHGVFKEYRKRATPGEGGFLVDPDYNVELHDEEINFADWVYTTFGGKLRCLNETDEDGVLNPDYLWNGALWDLKSPTTTKQSTLDKRIRHGLEQIETNPGGLMLDFENSPLSFGEASRMVIEILEKKAHTTTDVIVKKGKRFGVFRIKK